MSFGSGHDTMTLCLAPRMPGTGVAWKVSPRWGFVLGEKAENGER